MYKRQTLYDAASIAVSLAGRGTIEVRDKDFDFPSRGALDCTAAKKDFNYDPKVDVAEGFEIYYNWLKNDPFFKIA